MKPHPIESEEQSNVPSLVTLDLAETYSLIQKRQAERDVPLPAPDLQLHLFGSPIPELMLSRTSSPMPLLQLRPNHETMLPSHGQKLHPFGNPLVAMTLRQLDRDTYRVLMAPPHGAAQPVELDIPAGLPRVTNIATLKAMLGVDTWDIAFRRSADGKRWEICPDEFPVDLEDRTQVFKIRQWAILS